MRYIIALCLALWGTTTKADITVGEVLKLPLMQRSGCQDNETGEVGMCYLFQGSDGYYLLFTQKDMPVFMRYIKPPNPYVEVWRAPRGVSL